MKLSSTATNTGSATITIYFNQGTDPDMASVNVQNLEAPIGSLGESSPNVFQYTMKYHGRLKDMTEFSNMVVSRTTIRFNLYRSIQVNVNPAEGYSSGQAQQAIKEVAAQLLPTGYGYEYGGMAREEAASGGSQTVFVYAICIVLVFLIMVCLYESFLIPLAVIFSVPFGLMGSFLFAKLFGLENNIYLQTGMIMLIGLLAKTAILITEYAVERRRRGMGIVVSAYTAAQARLRPILMTVLCMVFGMLPLMFSSGAGANGNGSLATGVIGGMVVGTIALLFVTPVFYIIFEYLQEKLRKPIEIEASPQVQVEAQRNEEEFKALNKDNNQ